MGPVLEKPSQTSSVTIESNLHAPARVTRHRLTHAIIMAQIMFHNLNEQQTDPDPTTPVCRLIRHQTVVMQYNDADRFLHDMVNIQHLL